jgi:NADH-quinone oxidoreductase subunit L
VSYLAILIVFCPLLGFLLSFTLGQKLGSFVAQFITCALMTVSTVLAITLIIKLGFQEEPLYVPLFTWIRVEFLEVDWGIWLDQLSLVMIGVVTFISLLVHVYAIGYMKGDSGIPRFMAYLSLFTFFMLALVTAPNLLQLFFGWEGVGLCSYLLIGYWYERENANVAAFKAFLMNRVADLGFILGAFIVFTLFGSLDFSAIFELIVGHERDTFLLFGKEYHALTIACFLFFMAAMGKSAQIGFHTWLPDAMEAPTPVSALIHAATMVTAGVFLVVRLSPLLEYAPVAREFITIIGAITAFTTATIACVQNDIKRIIAYSTCSQLGYMFMAVGLSGYGAAMLHLTTHAFFKALLFLSAGSVIHAMSDENNIQRMGGIWKDIPITYTLMWIGSLALAGIPFFSGYYSKDLILELDWVSSLPGGKVAFVLAIVTVFLTAFYSWRLIFLTFHGAPRADDAVMSHIHESPLIMLIPLMILGAGSIFSGYALYGLFVGEETTFWRSSLFVLSGNNALSAIHEVGKWVRWSPTLVAFMGIGLAYVLYMSLKSWPDRLAIRFKGLYGFLYNKWYFDELYNRFFVLHFVKFSRFLWEEGDRNIIDTLGPNGVAFLSVRGGGLLCWLQTGYVYHYAFAMIVGIIALVGWYFWH